VGDEHYTRWDGEGLSGHAETIFKALVDLVTDFRVKCFKQSGKDIKKNLQDIVLLMFSRYTSLSLIFFIKHYVSFKWAKIVCLV